MKINKEGYKIIAISGVSLAAVWALLYYMIEARENNWLIILISVLLLMFWFFIVSFFREPRRIKIHDADLVFSPCDGRVVVTEVVQDDEYFKGKRLQVSIFMSVTNVHINWFPVGGVVKYFKYHPGRFLLAWHPKSSTDNERTTTVVETPKGVEVLFRQIAGFVARKLFKLNYYTLIGVLSGSMTNPPALAYSNEQTGSDAPSVGYATVYPLTMFLRVLTAQLLIIFFV